MDDKEQSLKTDNFGQNFWSLRESIGKKATNHEDSTTLKSTVMQAYNGFGKLIYNNSFLNWGFYNWLIHYEYNKLPFDFNRYSYWQDIYSQLLYYYLIRAPFKQQFFNKNILDIGCGTGIGLQMGNEIMRAKLAVGLDMSSEILSKFQAPEHIPGKVIRVQGDAEHIPLADHSFDIITSLESSHTYPYIDNFFNEVFRVLNYGGYFCYSDVHVETKSQISILEKVIKDRKDIKVIIKKDITKHVQKALYQRLVINEQVLIDYLLNMLALDPDTSEEDFIAFYISGGMGFLPKKWMRFSTKTGQLIAKYSNTLNYWPNKYYFYYCLQKIS